MDHGMLSVEGPQPVVPVGYAAAQEAHAVADAAV